jgi:hypothetical protein
MPERARTDLWEPWGSNPPGPPGRELLVSRELCRAVGLSAEPTSRLNFKARPCKEC